MANGNLEVRVERVEVKLDALSSSVDRRFDQVDAALMEQRQYTEVAYDRLDARFQQVDARFEQMDVRFQQMDARFEQIDGHFEQVDTRLDRVEGHLGRLDRKVDRILDLLSPPFGGVTGFALRPSRSRPSLALIAQLIVN